MYYNGEKAEELCRPSLKNRKALSISTKICQLSRFKCGMVELD